MFGISGTELLIILFFGFLIFGPDKLPQIGRTVGRAIRQFRDASEVASKKFKEEVADPFQEAIAPYKDQVTESTKPFQDDINAINQTFNETKSMFTDPFKDVFSSEPKQPAAKPVVMSTVADDVDVTATAKSEDTPEQANASQGSELAEAESASASTEDGPAKGRLIPEAGGSVKKSLASSLYDLDDGDGE